MKFILSNVMRPKFNIYFVFTCFLHISNKVKVFYGFMIISGVILTGCSGDYDEHVPLNSDEETPSQVKDVKIKEISGGAVLSYKIPEGENVSYVLASYERENGTKVQAKSSYYKNSIEIEGFSTTENQTVELQSVTKGEKKSEPLSVEFKPLMPSYISVYKSLKANATFGGVHVEFDNDSEDNIRLTVLNESSGEFSTVQNFYTKTKHGNFSVRGFDTTLTKFGFVVRDQWNNISDTLFAEVSPLHEEQIDRTNIDPVHLPTDTYEAHDWGLASIEGAFDGHYDDNPPDRAFHTIPGTGMPQWFTFDLGSRWELSRLKLYMRSEDAYEGPNVKDFEIWGSNDPNPDGSWDSWTLIDEFDGEIPSGEDAPTQDDIIIGAEEGHGFEFSPGSSAYRYLRFKTNATWGGVDMITIAELELWGNKEN